MAANGKFVAAICAAPKVLANAGLLDGKVVTAFPGTLDPASFPAVRINSQAVVRDGNILTSRGPGTAMDFALALIEPLCGPEQRQAVETPLQRSSTVVS